MPQVVWVALACTSLTEIVHMFLAFKHNLMFAYLPPPPPHLHTFIELDTFIPIW